MFVVAESAREGGIVRFRINYPPGLNTRQRRGGKPKNLKKAKAKKQVGVQHWSRPVNLCSKAKGPTYEAALTF